MALAKVGAFQEVLMVRKLPANTGGVDLIPGLERSPGGGNSNPIQYFLLENLMDRRAWWATVHGVCKESNTTEHLSRHTRCSLKKQQLTAYVTVCRCYSVTKLCPCHCNPSDCSPPGSSVHGVFQARILE